jgi:hypothetical protein
MKIVYYFLLLFLLVSQSILAQATLLSEDFENPNFPSDWSQNTNANDGGWILGINTALESEYWSIVTVTKVWIILSYRR